MIASPVSCTRSLHDLHVSFLAILPRIELHGRVCFRYLRCPHQREDAIAEMIALAWKWYVRLAERDKQPDQFPSALASYAARAVKSGRRLCGQESRQDVLAPSAQQAHAFAVESLLPASTLRGNLWEEALHDNTVSSVLDQVGWKLDFPRWRSRHSARHQAILDDLMIGEGTRDVASRHGLTAGRISQLRQAFHASWQRFHGEGSFQRTSVA